MLCCWIEDPNSEAFKLHIPRIFDYLWIAEDGMKMQVRKQYQSLSSLSQRAISILYVTENCDITFSGGCSHSQWRVVKADFVFYSLEIIEFYYPSVIHKKFTAGL